MAAVENTSEDLELLSRTEIVHNERLADGATGIDNHPKPLTQTRPLVDPADEAREFPYSK